MFRSKRRTVSVSIGEHGCAFDMGGDDHDAYANLVRLERVLRERIDLFDLYARKEEYDPVLRDRYDRFPYFLSREKDVLDPCVSAYLREKGFSPEYPEDKKFAVCLTHDVDFLFEAPEAKLNRAINSFASKDIMMMFKHIRQMPNRRIPNWTFEEVVRVEKRYNALSTFFFLANNPPERQANYYLDDVRSVMAELEGGGWEIGLHGGFDAYMDFDKLKREKGMLEKALGHDVRGYRGHYLKFRMPDTWELLTKAGFAYDTTIGYPDCVGFRNGMCHPYRPYNLRTGSWIEILEVPLVIMDTSLFEHMRLDADQAWELARTLLNKIKGLAGGVSINWHNSSFSGESLEFYERILRYCEESQAWMTTCDRLVEHLRTARYLQ